MYVLLAYEKDGGYYDELFRNKDLKYVEATGMGLMSVLKSNKLRACNGEPYDWLEIWNNEVDDFEPLLIITANGCL